MDLAEHGASAGSAEGATWRNWFVLAVLTISTFIIIGGTLTSIGVYVPALTAQQGWGERQVGAAATALLLGMSAASIVAGVLADRFDPRRVLSGGLATVAAGCAVAGWAVASAVFVLGFALIGVGAGLSTIVVSIAIITALFGEHRGIALGVYFAMMALASACVPPVVGLIIVAAGWRVALFLTAAAIAACLPFCLFMPLARGARHNDPAADVRTGLTVGAALRTPGFWCLTLAMTASLVSVNAIVFAFVPYLLDGGYAEPSAVSLYGFANFMSVPALFIGGAVADRWGARRVLPFVVLMLGVAALTLLRAGAPDATGHVAIGVFAILWGLSSGVPQIGSMQLEDVVGPRHFGAVLGINTALSGLVAGFAPLLTGVLREASGGYQLAFLLYGVATLAVAPLVLAAKPRFSPGSAV